MYGIEPFDTMLIFFSVVNNALSLHIRNLKKSKKVLTEWDDTVWTVMVEKAIVHKDKSISFIFYNGSKVRVGN